MKYSNQKQAGFTLIELTVVTAIIMILSVILIPNVNGFLIENKVPRVAEEVQRFVARAKINAQGLGANPYQGVDTSQLANSLRGSSVFMVHGAGASATVTHDIGRSNAPLTLSATAINTNGDAMQIEFVDVNSAACPSLATVLQKAAEKILINNTEVKAIGDKYQPTVAENACTRGDTNQFTFVMR